MSVKIDRSKAIKIATQFFKQHHSDAYVVNIILKDQVWAVTVSTGVTDGRIRKILIDASYGNILGYV